MLTVLPALISALRRLARPAVIPTSAAVGSWSQQAAIVAEGKGKEVVDNITGASIASATSFVGGQWVCAQTFANVDASGTIDTLSKQLCGCCKSDEFGIVSGCTSSVGFVPALGLAVGLALGLALGLVLGLAVGLALGLRLWDACGNSCGCAESSAESSASQFAPDTSRLHMD